MKRHIAFTISLIIAMGLLLSSCAKTATSTPSVSTAEQPSLSMTQPQETRDLLEVGFELMKNESLGGIYCTMTLESAIALLGQANSEDEPELWGADGLYHWSLSYDDIGLQIDIVNETSENEGAEVFSMMATTSFDGKTSRGIQIGSARNDVLEAYKDEINEEESSDHSIVAGSVFGGIIFYLDGADKVEGIFIGASAE